MWKPIKELFGRNNLYLRQHLFDPLFHLCLTLSHFLNSKWLRYDLFDNHPRVERFERILKNYLHLTPQRLQLSLRKLGDILPMKEDAPTCGADYPQRNLPESRLSS